MNTKLTTALRRMGYRHMGKGVWAKPVAYHLFTVRLVKDVPTFTNYFLGAKKKILVYDNHVISDKDGGYEDSLKFAEYSTRTNVGSLGFNSDFGFLTKEDAIADFANLM